MADFRLVRFCGYTFVLMQFFSVSEELEQVCQRLQENSERKIKGLKKGTLSNIAGASLMSRTGQTAAAPGPGKPPLLGNRQDLPLPLAREACLDQKEQRIKATRNGHDAATTTTPGIHCPPRVRATANTGIVLRSCVTNRRSSVAAQARTVASSVPESPTSSS
jgi:hypothetical protein